MGRGGGMEVERGNGSEEGPGMEVGRGNGSEEGEWERGWGG